MSRMLLSRTFNLEIGDIPKLSREQFTQVFINALQDCSTCHLIDNPREVLEVLVDVDQIMPSQLGDRFLEGLSWDVMVPDRPTENIFKSVLNP